MNDEILEKLLTKLIGLTEFGVLRWHFAGDVSKAYVTVYKDARLKLTEVALDITEAEGDTVRIDTRIHADPLPKLVAGLYKASKESCGRFRTGQVKSVSSASLEGTCKRLLEDEVQVVLYDCLACTEQFDPGKASNYLSQKEASPAGKIYHICQGCVGKIGSGEAQILLNRATKLSIPGESEDAISGETLSDVGISGEEPKVIVKVKNKVERDNKVKEQTLEGSN